MSSPTKRQKAVNAAAAAAKEAELAERLEANMNELVKLSDEKLNIATQVGLRLVAGAIECVSSSGCICMVCCCFAVSNLHVTPAHSPRCLGRFTTTSTATSPSWTRTARPLMQVRCRALGGQRSEERRVGKECS